MSMEEFEKRLRELKHSIAIERWEGFKVYNLDKRKIQELRYPAVITMSDETDEVAEMRLKAEVEHDRKRTALIMDVAQDEIAKDPVMRASSQVEGGFFVVADPNEVAFFECMFKPPRPGLTREEAEKRARRLDTLVRAMTEAEHIIWELRKLYYDAIDPHLDGYANKHAKEQLMRVMKELSELISKLEEKRKLRCQNN